MANVMTQTSAETVAAAGAEQIFAELQAIDRRFHEGRFDEATYEALYRRQMRFAELRGLAGYDGPLMRLIRAAR